MPPADTLHADTPSVRKLFIPPIITLPAQTGYITGRLIYEHTMEPAPGVRVQLSNCFLHTLSDTNGYFIFTDVPSGRYELIVTGDQCEPLTTKTLRVHQGDTLTHDMTLRLRIVLGSNYNITADRRITPVPPGPVPALVISAAEIKQRDARTLEEALGHVDGLHFNGAQLNIRGLADLSPGVGGRALLLVDGLPFYAAHDAALPLNGIPVFAASQIEVVKGANSALYGPGAYGGLVNVITRPVPPGQHARAMAYTGIFLRPRPTGTSPTLSRAADARFYAGGEAWWTRKSDDLGFLLSASARRDAGDYRRTRLGLYAKMTWQLDYRTDLQFFGALGADNNDGSIDRLATDTAALDRNGPPQTKFDNGLASIGFQYRRVAEPTFTYMISGNYFRSYFAEKDGIPGDDAGRNAASDNYNATVQLASVLNRHVRFNYGISVAIGEIRSTVYGDHGTRDAGLYGQIEFGDRSEVLANVGVRLDGVGTLDSGIAAVYELSPRVAVMYCPNPRTTLRIVASRGFRPATTAERFTNTTYAGRKTKPNVYLTPERIWHGEIGGSYEEPVNDWLGISGDCSFFTEELYGLIEPVIDPGDNRVYFNNVHRGRVLGIDASISGAMRNPSIRFKAGLSAQSARDVLLDQRLPGRPGFIAYATATWKYQDMNVTLDYRHYNRLDGAADAALAAIPSFYAQGAVNAFDLHSNYTVADLLPDQPFPFTISLHLRNLFNVNYIDGTGNNELARRVELGLSAGF